MMRLSKLFTLFIVLLAICNQGLAQPVGCESFRNGVFYEYPPNSADHYMLRREGANEYEKSLVTGDSSIFKVAWLDGCSYTLKFVKSSTKYRPELLAYLKEHVLAYQIVNQTADYYVFQCYIDKIKGKPVQTDTVWLKEKANYVSSEIFRPITDERLLKKNHFSDTSSYAVLYIYRPGKVGAMLAELPATLNDIPACVMTNKSLYMFRIAKEGRLKINTQLNKQKPAELWADIKFGRKYYVKSTLRFTANTISGWKPELESVPVEQGQADVMDIPPTR